MRARFTRNTGTTGAAAASAAAANRAAPAIADDHGEMPPPRILTPRPDDVTGSYGAAAELWIATHLGDRLRPWQRLVLDRALEHRADGSLRWEQVLLTVSRQQGKTILERGLCGWRASSRATCSASRRRS